MKSVFSNIKRRLSVEPKLSTSSSEEPFKTSQTWSRSDSMLISGSIPAKDIKSAAGISPLESIKESSEPVGPTRMATGSVPPSASARKEPLERSTTLKSKRSQGTFARVPERVEGKAITAKSVTAESVTPEPVTPDSIEAPAEKQDQSTLGYMAIGRMDLRDWKLASSAKVNEDFTTLKPVVREKVYHHVVEEVQKVHIQERHVTHIRHHVQPIIQPEGFRHEGNIFRMGSLSTKDSTKAVTLTQGEIDVLLQQHLSRYHDSARAEHICPPSKTVNLPEIEKTATIVHKYDIIQPVIVQPDPDFRFSFATHGQPILEEVVIGGDTTLKPKRALESEVYRLTTKVHELKAQNNELKSLLNLANQRATLIHHKIKDSVVKAKKV